MLSATSGYLVYQNHSSCSPCLGKMIPPLGEPVLPPCRRPDLQVWGDTRVSAAGCHGRAGQPEWCSVSLRCGIIPRGPGRFTDLLYDGESPWLALVVFVCTDDKVDLFGMSICLECRP